ncbi:hypothetical protein Ocin01_11098, partial [Orchesella cincta]
MLEQVRSAPATSGLEISSGSSSSPSSSSSSASPSSLSQSPSAGMIMSSGEEGEDGIYHFASVAVGTGCLVAVVLLAAVFLRCYSNWKSSRYHRQLDDEETSSTKANIRISHSLPDLSQDMAKHEYIQEVKEKKLSKRKGKWVKQTPNQIK